MLVLHLVGTGLLALVKECRTLISLNKTSQVAIAAMGYLAEIHAQEGVRLSAAEIARSRKLQAPFVAKIMSSLSQARLVTSTPGPGGGFRLARAPHEVVLGDITALFERDEEQLCPYGPHYCGKEEKCPLHDQITALDASLGRYLSETTLEGFTNKKRKDTESAEGAVAK